MSEINLLTSEEKLEQKIQVISKVLNIVLGLGLVIAGGLGYYFNNLVQPLLVEKSELDAQVTSLRSEVTQYSTEELALRDINARYVVAQKFRNEKILYELLMKEIYERNTSGGVVIKTITVTTEKDLVAVRVTSDSTSFKRFVDNLKASQVSESNIKDLFSNSGIPEDVNEVSKEYVVTVKYNKGLLNAK